MSIPVQFGASAAWVQARFGVVALGDKHRTARVVALAAGSARLPGASIPRLVGGSYAAKVAYGLLAWPTAPPDAPARRPANHSPPAYASGQGVRLHALVVALSTGVNSSKASTWPANLRTRSVAKKVPPG